MSSLSAEGKPVHCLCYWKTSYLHSCTASKAVDLFYHHNRATPWDTAGLTSQTQQYLDLSFSSDLSLLPAVHMSLVTCFISSHWPSIGSFKPLSSRKDGGGGGWGWEREIFFCAAELLSSVPALDVQNCKTGLSPHHQSNPPPATTWFQGRSCWCETQFWSYCGVSNQKKKKKILCLYRHSQFFVFNPISFPFFSNEVCLKIKNKSRKKRMWMRLDGSGASPGRETLPVQLQAGSDATHQWFRNRRWIRQSVPGDSSPEQQPQTAPSHVQVSLHLIKVQLQQGGLPDKLQSASFQVVNSEAQNRVKSPQYFLVPITQIVSSHAPQLLHHLWNIFSSCSIMYFYTCRSCIFNKLVYVYMFFVQPFWYWCC